MSWTQQASVVVVVPEGTAPGQTLQVTVPGVGSPVQAVIPEGCTPGNNLTILLPSEPPPPPQQPRPVVATPIVAQPLGAPMPGHPTATPLPAQPLAAPVPAQPATAGLPAQPHGALTAPVPAQPLAAPMPAQPMAAAQPVPTSIPQQQMAAQHPPQPGAAPVPAQPLAPPLSAQQLSEPDQWMAKDVTNTDANGDESSPASCSNSTPLTGSKRKHDGTAVTEGAHPAVLRLVVHALLSHDDAIDDQGQAVCFVKTEDGFRRGYEHHLGATLEEGQWGMTLDGLPSVTVTSGDELVDAVIERHNGFSEEGDVKAFCTNLKPTSLTEYLGLNNRNKWEKSVERVCALLKEVTGAMQQVEPDLSNVDQLASKLKLTGTSHAVFLEACQQSAQNV